MARIAGVNIPNNKHTEIALTAIFGIGRNTAQKICAAAGVLASTKMKDLNDADVEKLRDEVAKVKVAIRVSVVLFFLIYKLHDSLVPAVPE